MEKAFVNKKGAKRVRNGHLWIYKSDVLRVEASGGDVVSVFDEGKNFVGKAFYSDSSEITLRIFTIQKDEIDKEFWRKRILEAKNRRTKGKGQSANAKRLVYTEGDLIPSLIIDDYAGVIVIQTLSQGTEKLKQTFVEILREEFSPTAIIERNDVKVRGRENLPEVTSVLDGEVPDEIIINQNGIKPRGIATTR